MFVMVESVNLKSEEVAEKLVEYLKSTNKKFLFISGNGGSGKTELCKVISKLASKYGSVNVLNMDDFILDINLRNNAKMTWLDSVGIQQVGRCTSSCMESYFLKSIKAIIYNLEKGNSCYHWPKRAKSSDECRLLHGDFFLTIVEGVGTVFLDKNVDNSVSVFVKCAKDIEITRRIKRGKYSNEKSSTDVNKMYDERNGQFKANIEPHIHDYESVLDSMQDYSFNVLRDDNKIF